MLRECIGFHLSTIGSNHAKLKPVYECFNGVWLDVVPDSFPPNDSIFDYFYKSELIDTYNLVYFKCKKSPNIKKNTDDFFIVEDGTHEFLYQVIDFSHLEFEEARYIIFENGIRQDTKTKTKHNIYILLKSNYIVQIQVNLNPTKDLWYANNSKNNHFITLYLENGLASDLIRKFKGTSFLLPSDVNNLKIVGIIDWCNNKDLFEKIYKKTHQITRHYELKEAFLVIEDIKKAIYILQAYGIFNELTPSNILSEQYENRIISLIDKLSKDWSFYQYFYEKLINSPEYQKFVENKFQEEVQDLKNQYIQEISSKIEAELRENKTILGQEIENLEDTKQHIIDMIEKKNQEILMLESNIQSVEAELGKYNSDINYLLNISNELSHDELHILRKLQNKLQTNHPQQALGFLPSLYAPWSSILSNSDINTIKNIDDFHQKLNIVAGCFGVKNSSIENFDYLLRTNTHVLLIEKDVPTLDIINAYANTVCGGRVTHIPLDPSFIGLDDFWRSPGTMQPTAFAQTWHKAMLQPEQYYLIHLFGLEQLNDINIIYQLTQLLRQKNYPKNLLLISSLGMNTSSHTLQWNIKDLAKCSQPFILGVQDFQIAKALKYGTQKESFELICHYINPAETLIEANPKHYKEFNQLWNKFRANIEKHIDFNDIPEIINGIKILEELSS